MILNLNFVIDKPEELDEVHVLAHQIMVPESKFIQQSIDEMWSAKEKCQGIRIGRHQVLLYAPTNKLRLSFNTKMVREGDKEYNLGLMALQHFEELKTLSSLFMSAANYFPYLDQRMQVLGVKQWSTTDRPNDWFADAAGRISPHRKNIRDDYDTDRWKAVNKRELDLLNEVKTRLLLKNMMPEGNFEWG